MRRACPHTIFLLGTLPHKQIKETVTVLELIEWTRYLDDLLNIGKTYFEGTIKQINQHELQCHRYRSSFSDLLSMLSVSLTSKNIF